MTQSVFGVDQLEQHTSLKIYWNSFNQHRSDVVCCALLALFLLLSLNNKLIWKYWTSNDWTSDKKNWLHARKTDRNQIKRSQKDPILITEVFNMRAVNWTDWNRAKGATAAAVFDVIKSFSPLLFTHKQTHTHRFPTNNMAMSRKFNYCNYIRLSGIIISSWPLNN